MCSRRNELQLAINNGDRGRVLAVDPEQHRLECEGGTVEPAAGLPPGRTEYGDPTLLHEDPPRCTGRTKIALSPTPRRTTQS